MEQSAEQVKDVTKATVATVEKADKAVARGAAEVRDAPAIRLLGLFGELGDQPPMIALCATTIVAGLVRRDGRLASAGLRMLAAHALATGVKHVIKRSVDRTRPKLLVDEGRYEAQPGHSSDGDRSSFPSGHTAGALAVARAVARAYPGAAVPAYSGAAVIAGVQIPRCHHYVSDIGAGALIGVAAEAATSWSYDRLGLADAIASWGRSDDAAAADAVRPAPPSAGRPDRSAPS